MELISWKGSQDAATVYKSYQGKAWTAKSGTPAPTPAPAADVAKKSVSPPKKAETKAPAKKEPKKYCEYNTWYIENFGKETIVLEGDENVSASHQVQFTNCVDTTLVIKGKIKNVMLNRNEKVKLQFDAVVVSVEVLNSKKVTIYAKDQVPQVMLENSSSVNFYAFPPAKKAKFNTTCSQSVVLHFQKDNATEEDEWLDIPIAETFLTLIKNDKLTTEPLEGME